MKIFHHNDLDGKSSAFIANYFTVETTNPDVFVELSHDREGDSKKLSDIDEGERVIIVDYSFGEDTLNDLKGILKKTTNVTWIDHHKTSIELISHYPELNKIPGYRKEGYSGAALAYMYYSNPASNEDWDTRFKQLPYWVQLISDYDCWKKQFRDSDYFKMGMDTIGYEPLDPIWHELIKVKSTVSSDLILSIISKGEIVKGYIDQNNKYLRETYGYESSIDGIKAFVVNSEGNSWVFGDLIKQYPIVALWTFDGEKYNYSIYSDGQVDCSKIAANHGGGGHPGASGFQSTELVFKKSYPEVEEKIQEANMNYIMNYIKDHSTSTSTSSIFDF